MTDQTLDSTDIDLLTRRLRNAEKSIEFLQNEHAQTLNQLHSELAKWHEKYSDLTFRSAIQNVTIPSVDHQQLRAKKERQENEIRQLKETISTLRKLIEEKDEVRRDFERRLATLDQQHALELHAQHTKQRELQKELDQRAMMIAKLTEQLQREKEHQQTVAKRTSLSQMILPDKPTKLKPHDESPRQQQQQQQRASQKHRSISNRSSSLNIRDNREDETVEVLLLRRRPPTPPQQLRSPSIISAASNNDSLLTPRQRQLGNLNSKTSVSSRLETKLPPIAIRKMPLRAPSGSFIQQNTEL